jgi:hypothetical protein
LESFIPASLERQVIGSLNWGNGDDRPNAAISSQRANSVIGNRVNAVHENDLGSIRYLVDHARHIIYAERDDDLTKRRIFAEWEAIQRIERFDPAYDTIVDYSRVTRVDLDTADLVELNREMPRRDRRTGNVAIVAGLNTGGYLLARFFCTIANLSKERKHQVFQSTAEAEFWLLSLRKY